MTAAYTTQYNCRICGHVIESVCDLGPIPLSSVFPLPHEPDPPKIPVQVMLCPSCRLLQLGHNTNPELIFKDGYGYKSGINESMIKHLNAIVRMASKYVRAGDAVLDIGSNDGTLLNLWKGYGVDRFGMDPIGDDVKGATVFKEYFQYHGTKYKVITSISMLYDLVDPIAFAKDVERSLTDDGVWIIEVGYAGALLKGNWDGIGHEHLGYYGLTQFAHIAQRVGLNVIRFQFSNTNGGSILVILGRENPCYIGDIIEEEVRWDWSILGDIIRMTSKNVRKQCASHSRTVYCLGASTKGQMLLSQAWLNHSLIPYAIERNPAKIGRRTGVGNIPIQSEEFLRENMPSACLVLPYHFKDIMLERYADLRERGMKMIFPLPDVLEL